MHKVLVNHLVKLVKEKVWIDELTVSTLQTIAVDWDVEPLTKQNLDYSSKLTLKIWAISWYLSHSLSEKLG